MGRDILNSKCLQSPPCCGTSQTKPWLPVDSWPWLQRQKDCLLSSQTVQNFASWNPLASSSRHMCYYPCPKILRSRSQWRTHMLCPSLGLSSKGIRQLPNFWCGRPTPPRQLSLAQWAFLIGADITVLICRKSATDMMRLRKVAYGTTQARESVLVPLRSASGRHFCSGSHLLMVSPWWLAPWRWSCAMTMLEKAKVLLTSREHIILQPVQWSIAGKSEKTKLHNIIFRWRA